jgi:uncharacterized protein (TIGR02444 family)
VRHLKHDARDSGTSELQYDNEFWRFSLSVYAQSDVAKECLALQAALEIDVNLLLFCAWLGTRAIALRRADIETASTAVADWQEQVIRPLRNVRQHIKTLARDDFESFRAKVKGAELEAEQVEQAILFAYSKRIDAIRANAGSGNAIAGNIKEYVAMKSGGVAGKSPQLSASSLIEAADRFKA